MKYLTRLGAIVLAVALLLVATNAKATIENPVDESDPELVKAYIFLSCDILKHSYKFQLNELRHLYERFKACDKAAERNPEFEYGKALCLYVKMQGKFLYSHIKSIEKALELMCDEEGRKDPQYEISF